MPANVRSPAKSGFSPNSRQRSSGSITARTITALPALARIDVHVVDLPVAAEQRRELEADGRHVRRQQRKQVRDHQVRKARVPGAAEVDADRQRHPDAELELDL